MFTLIHGGKEKIICTKKIRVHETELLGSTKETKTLVFQVQDSNIIGKGKVVMERWKQHFFWNSNNNETQRQEMIYKENEPYIEVPTRNEVFEVIKDVNTYKAREEESNSAELVKYGRLGLW
jgi:hypothetical protein